jgi:hypothetical protein
MPSGKKCPDCNLCLDVVFLIPRRFLHCFLCGKYYDILDGKLTIVIPEEEVKKLLDLIIKQQEEREKENVNVRLA